MSKTNFVIFSEDQDYAISWGRYLSKRKGIPFEVRIFSNERELKEYSKKEKIEILLLDKTERLEDVHSEVKFILYEQGFRGKKEEGSYYIDKFQSATAIISQISEVCINEKKDYLKQKKEKESVKIIGIYSPVNRCYKTLLSVAIANAISKDYSTLYLNFEEYSCLNKIFSVNNQGTISELIYYFKEGAGFLGMRFLSVLNRWDKLDYLLPPVCKEDIEDLSFEEFKELINKMKKFGDYKYFVIDLGNSLNNMPKVLEYCDEIIMPIREDEISSEKITDFERYMEERQKEEILSKVTKLDLESYEKEIQAVDIEHLINSKFGGDIRKMVSNYLETGKWNLKLFEKE